MNIRYMGFLLLFFQQLVNASSTEIVAQQPKQISSAQAQTFQAQVAKLNSKKAIVENKLIVQATLQSNEEQKAILQQDVNKMKTLESDLIKKQKSLACDEKLLDLTIRRYKTDAASYGYSDKYEISPSIKEALVDFATSKRERLFAKTHEQIKLRDQKIEACEKFVEQVVQQDLQQKKQAVADELARLKLDFDANMQQQATIADNYAQLNFLDSLLAEKREQINTDKWQKLVGKKVAQRQDANRYAVESVEDLINGVYQQEQDRLMQAALAQQEAERLQAQAKLAKKQGDAAVAIETATRGFLVRRQLPSLRKEHTERIAQQKIDEELVLAKAQADKEKAEQDRLAAEQKAESARQEQELALMQAEEKYERNRLVTINQEKNKEIKRLAKERAQVQAFERKKQAELEAAELKLEIENKRLADEQAKKQAAAKVEAEKQAKADSEKQVAIQTENKKKEEAARIASQETAKLPKAIIIKRPEFLITKDQSDESLKQAAVQRRTYFEELQNAGLDSSEVTKLMKSEDDKNDMYDKARLAVYQLQEFLQRSGSFYNAPYGEYICSHVIKINNELQQEGASMADYFKDKDLILATLAARLIVIEDVTQGMVAEKETADWTKLNDLLEKNQKELKILVFLKNQEAIEKKIYFLKKLEDKVREKAFIVNNFMAFYLLKNIQTVITPQSQVAMDDKLPSVADIQKSVSLPFGTVGSLTPENLQARRIIANNFIDNILRNRGCIDASNLVPLVAKFIENIDFNNEKIDILAPVISKTIMQAIVMLDGEALTEEKKQEMFKSLVEGAQAAKSEDLAILADIAKMHGMLVEILCDRQQAAKNNH